MQVAPFSQSLSSQSSVLILQVGPSKPSAQVQLQHHAHQYHIWTIEIFPNFSVVIAVFIPIFSLIILVDSTGSSVGTRAADAGIQAWLAVLTLMRKQVSSAKDLSRNGGLQENACSHLESRWTAAPVDLYWIIVTDAVVHAGVWQAGVTLREHRYVHITCRNPTTH